MMKWGLMTSGRHSAGKPRQLGLFAYAVIALTAFTAGILTAMYLPDGPPPPMASAATGAPMQGNGKAKGGDKAEPVAAATTSASVETSQSASNETTSSAPAAETSATLDANGTITVLGVGDILVHKEIWAQALEDGGGNPEGDFSLMLDGIRPRVEGVDLAMCHMEYPFAAPEGPVTYWPDLPAAPWSLAKGVADVGFDTCSTVSNHTQDQGAEGIKNLLDALDANGVAHSGTGRTEDEANRITTVEVKGVTIALLAYSYGLYDNGYAWMTHANDVDAIVADAQRARDEGAQIVIVNLHDGEENYTEPDESQLNIAQTLADAGTVDLIVGQHTHCVQPVQKIGDMWVAYGHGNLLTAQSRKDMRTADGLVTQWTFAPDDSGRWRVVDAAGIAIEGSDWPFRINDLSALGSARSDSDQASYDRTVEAVMGLGAADAGFHML